MDWTHRLRLRHLQVLLSLSETGNLSLSADRLSTTQPALSKWLKELEADIGLRLFERHARGLRATHYGEALIEHARRIDSQLDTARDDMRAMFEGSDGIVAIGTSGVSAGDPVPLAVSRLLATLPAARVRIVESTFDVLLPMLERGEIDLVVGRTDQEPARADICSETLYSEPINFVARPNHPLSLQCSVSWPDVKRYPWIVWPKGTPIRNALEQALADVGETLPPNCIDSNSSTFNITLLNTSDLIGVASHRAAMRFEELNALRILPLPLAVYGSVAVYWDPESLKRNTVKAAFESLKLSADPAIAIEEPLAETED